MTTLTRLPGPPPTAPPWPLPLRSPPVPFHGRRGLAARLHAGQRGKAAASAQRSEQPVASDRGGDCEGDAAGERRHGAAIAEGARR